MLGAASMEGSAAAGVGVVGSDGAGVSGGGEGVLGFEGGGVMR